MTSTNTWWEKPAELSHAMSILPPDVPDEATRESMRKPKEPILRGTPEDTTPEVVRGRQFSSSPAAASTPEPEASSSTQAGALPDTDHRNKAQARDGEADSRKAEAPEAEDAEEQAKESEDSGKRGGWDRSTLLNRADRRRGVGGGGVGSRLPVRARAGRAPSVDGPGT